MIQMFGLTRKKSQNELIESIRDEILDSLEESQAESDKKVLEQDKLVRKIMSANDPTDLEKQIQLFDLKKDFTRRLEQSDRSKLWRMREKRKKGQTDEEEETEPGQLPTVDIKAQTDAIQKYLGGLSGPKLAIVRTATKMLTGHSVDEILANPTLLVGMYDKIKDYIPNQEDKKKTGFVNSQGKEIDPYDPTGYSMTP